MSWLERDRGKHQLTPDHKQALMEYFAAELWRSGRRYWTVSDVEQWLVDFLEQHPEMARHYRNILREPLKEDLRTATFLVRDGEDQFRFAHTSLQEFFLAGYLRRALIGNQPGRWAIPPVSRETLDFLGQWLEEQDENRQAALTTLSGIRDSYHPQASELALAYCLMAHAKGYPAPPMSGFQLAGSDLTGWEFMGTRETPLLLDGIHLEGARLWNTRWRHCHIRGAILTKADASRAEFLNCRMPDSDWAGAVLEAVCFRDCDLSRASFEEIRSRKTQWSRCGLTEARGIPETPPEALLALNQPPSAPPQGETQRRLWVANGHGEPVTNCAWSADGRWIVSASGDRTLRIWDTETGQSLLTLTGHQKRVNGCAWSADGRRIVSVSWDNTLRIWDAETGQRLRTLTGHESG